MQSVAAAIFGDWRWNVRSERRIGNQGIIGSEIKDHSLIVVAKSHPLIGPLPGGNREAARHQHNKERMIHDLRTSHYPTWYKGNSL